MPYLTRVAFFRRGKKGFLFEKYFLSHFFYCLAAHLIIWVMTRKPVDAVDIFGFDRLADPDKMEYSGQLVAGFWQDAKLESVL